MNTDERRGFTSASNATADSLCPGRHLAQKGLPESKSAEATFGTQIHDALAKGDPSGLTAEQQSIYEACKEVEAKVVAQVFGDDADKAVCFRERRFWYFNSIEHSGKADVVYRYLAKLLVIDYKTLPGEVPDSPSNMQLRDLVVLASNELLGPECYVAIIQPLVTHSPEICMYDKHSLAQARAEMVARVKASNHPKSPRIAGEVQCKYCRAKHLCREYAVWSGAELPQVPPLTTAMQSWTPEQRTIVAEKLPQLRRLLDDAEAFLKSCLESDPDAVPGYMLKQGATRSNIVKPQVLFDRFSELGGSLEQFIGCVKITKGDLEAAVREATGLKGRGLSERISMLLDGITESKQTAPSLVKKT